jgi:hypothetical protein
MVMAFLARGWLFRVLLGSETLTFVVVEWLLRHFERASLIFKLRRHWGIPWVDSRSAPEPRPLASTKHDSFLNLEQHLLVLFVLSLFLNAADLFFILLCEELLLFIDFDHGIDTQHVQSQFKEL